MADPYDRRGHFGRTHAITAETMSLPKPSTNPLYKLLRDEDIGAFNTYVRRSSMAPASARRKSPARSSETRSQPKRFAFRSSSARACAAFAAFERAPC